MKTIHFVRHAQSSYNKYRSLDPDVDLSSEGEEQCKSLSGSYDLVIISPLKRARRTLDLSNLKYNKLEVSWLCREKKTGVISDYLKDEELIVETDEEVNERAKLFKFLLKILSLDYNRILVVSHAIFGKSLIGRLLSNCEVVDITDEVLL